MTLGAVHRLHVPANPWLPASDPFAELAPRISRPADIGSDDRSRLKRHLMDLRGRYGQLQLGESQQVIHGDAWQDNVAVPATGTPILPDLEHVSVGHAKWDLIPLAVDYTDFARLGERDYLSLVDAYGGRDVTDSPHFRTLTGIQELRWVCFAISKSACSVSSKTELQHRIACLKGEVARPWSWRAF